MIELEEILEIMFYLISFVGIISFYVFLFKIGINKLKKSCVVHQKLVIKDKDGNIIKEISSNNGGNDILKNKIANDNKVIKRTMAVSITKDPSGNVVVRDRNGNKLEGDAKKEALEIFEKAKAMSGQETKKAKLTPEQERMNEQYLESVERQKAENKRLRRLKEEIRLEAENLMNNNPVNVEDKENIFDEEVIIYDDDTDDCGIKRY